MKNVRPMAMSRSRFFRVGFVLFLARKALGGPRRAGQGTNKRTIEVEEGWALQTLKEAALQAKVSFIVSEEIVRGVKTQAIKGRYTPIEAFESMLKGTALVVFQHRKSGVYGVKRYVDPRGSEIELTRNGRGQ